MHGRVCGGGMYETPSFEKLVGKQSQNWGDLLVN